MMKLTNHGGIRPGAGRPPGSRNRSTIDREQLSAEAIARMHAAGIANEVLTPAGISAMSPLEVLSYAMTFEACAGRWVQAAALAKEIAPYRHAKLSHVVTDTTIRNISDMSDAELEMLVSRISVDSNEVDEDEAG